MVDVTFARQPDTPKSRDLRRWAAARPSASAPSCTGASPTGCAVLAPAASLEVLEGNTGTNAAETQIAREGIPTGLVSLPQRYMHTPVETVRLGDIDACARLIADWILSLGEEASA